MSNLRRFPANGRPCFITSVTYQRRKILVNNADLLSDSLKTIETRYNFESIAWAILPDHFHLIIDTQDHDLSRLIQSIKMSFAVRYRIRHNLKSGRVWQNRFWDHLIRNQDDLNKHIDYIHYNPVKHGVAKNPFEWKHSSIHEYKESGYYALDWGRRDTIGFDESYGE